jgi:hypothetical protein
MEIKDNTLLFGKKKEEETVQGPAITPVVPKAAEESSPEHPKEKQLKEALVGVDADGAAPKVFKHSMVFVVNYDPVMRDVSITKVQGVTGMTDLLASLRDTVYQLEQMELTRKIIGNVAGIVQQESAKLFANLKTGGRV